MAKIGTAHVEIKPVLNEEALAALVQRIEDAIKPIHGAIEDVVARGVALGLAAHHAQTHPEVKTKIYGRIKVEDPYGRG